MTIVFDNNVIIDALTSRPGSEVARQLVLASASGQIGGAVPANSLNDIYYVVSKVIGKEKAREAIQNMMAVFSILTVDEFVCSEAINSKMNDFEDAIISICADMGNADYIITRDKGFLSSEYTRVPAVLPEAVLEMLKQSDSEPDISEE